ncbi:hypothetical protein DID88_009652 [Monilinia fructigena]|uniref:Mid2 domain-containing protein n=1 Tax=Monilinia fructigena TaxID=38457 RepID=A0A395IP23_9HELO|nr:hypothetical protein DID88_009652 [Monilinia fructigena]
MSSAKTLRIPWTPAIETSTARDRAPVQGGWSPKPTAAPNKALQALELLKRQTNGINTCGYFNGVEYSPAFYLMSDHPVTDAGSMTVTPIVTISQSSASVASSIQDGNDAQDVTSASGNVITSAGARSSASPSSSATTATHKKSSVPLGAIIGGVIGGVAVIVLLMFAIIFFLRRKKSKPSPPQHPPQASAILPNNPYQGPSPNHPQPFYENRASIAKPGLKNPKELANTVYIPPAISEYYQPPKDNPPVSPNADTQRYSDHQIYRNPDYQYSELDATALNSLSENGVELDGVAGRPSHGTEIGPSR